MQIKTPKFIIAALLVISISACKKDMNDSLAPGTTSNDTLTQAANKLKDTALMFSKDLYLWYNQIPTTFNARSYSDLAALMKGIRQYSRESGFANPVDRWSFAIKKEEWALISSGAPGNFGLNVSFNDENDLRVKVVDASSPAGKAGIRRGWKIIAINGNANMSTGNADFIVNNVLNSPTASFTFLKPDGTTTDIRLATTSIQDHSIYLDTVYNYGGKKIGYFVFNSFLGDTTKIYDQFQKTFNRFANAKISDLIVDLRYNGGGYVSVQQKLANYLAPNSANGGLMMKETFNDKSLNYNTTEYFEKIGTLNIPRIVFIVSNSTASASELLINNLKPYMDVKLVGPGNTYGKPVGYFPIEVGEWDIFPISFRSTNKNGDGNFFNGITVNSLVKDDLNKDWGDLEEACLARSIRYLSTGSFTTRIASKEDDNSYVEQPQVKAGNEVLESSAFKGLIDPRGM